MSSDDVSTTCTAVVLSVSTRVLRNSRCADISLRKVMLTPHSGAKDSLIDTELILYMLLGIGLPVVTSSMNPRPFIYSM